MTLSDIQRLLVECETHPTRNLGQNFLHDQNLARWIVALLDIQPGDHIVEIGPGLGSLTEFLASETTRLTLIEKDSRLVPYLKAKFEHGVNRVHHADALEFDLRELWGHGPVKIIGNLPYYISTPLIAKYASALSPASALVLTLQLELAQRLGAAHDTSDYGAMTLCTGRRWDIRLERKLPASVFFPRPKVDSAVITLRRKSRQRVRAIDDSIFESLVRRGFSERRKQLRNLLPEFKNDWEKITAAIGAPPTVRAEQLSPAQWESLAFTVSPSTAQHGAERFDVVDDQDRVLRPEFRDVIHVNNLLHRAVHILLFNASGELYLQKRSIWKDRNPGLWDSSAAGHVDAGEDYITAARRELREELGIEAPDLEPLLRLSPKESNGWEFIQAYRGRHDGPFHPAPMEVETGSFFPMEKIRHWAKQTPGDFSPVFLEILKNLP
ncbi:MAG: 16S rRNA (adenine(1518)-N(6)/adenine(1519)-N(6))-dimethyltransferase RsmA [bacterium]